MYNNENRHNNQRNRPRPVSEYEEKIVDVARVTRVVKGGRRMRFRVLVVIGNKKGRIGAGIAKGSEVPTAMRKAIETAKKKMLDVVITDSGSIPHETRARFSASEIVLFPAPEGSSLVSGGTARTVLELAGYKNIVSKSLGSNNKLNCVFATLEALENLKKRNLTK